MTHSLRHQWFSNVRGDLLSGLVVALAPIPEAIAFSIIAGVDPKVGLYASFCIAVVIAFVGGRPGMISRSCRYFVSNLWHPCQKLTRLRDNRFLLPRPSSAKAPG